MLVELLQLILSTGQFKVLSPNQQSQRQGRVSGMYARRFSLDTSCMDWVSMEREYGMAALSDCS